MLALQVTAQWGNVLASLELTPDRMVQRIVKLGKMEADLRVIQLDLAVEYALRNSVAHQLMKHLALDGQHLPAERIVHAARGQASVVDIAAIEVIDLQPTHELGLELKAIGCKEPRLDEL